ncbi:MAG: UvrB/UvrC motif-containing protein [Candidatus Scalindua sp.]|nr:UvrB/UvrC motif-containing protein [Candidatus Scalindua sp.]
MKCDSCGKKIATVHLTEIVGTEKKEKHLCEECAHNVTNHFPKAPSPSDILTSIINQVSPEIEEMSKTTCPVCDLSYLEFRSQGRLGCPMDYDAFQKGLLPLIERMHGSSQHVGKVPANASEEVIKKNQLIQLRKELNRAVQKEDYEMAAQIRDKIYGLSGNVDNGD